MVATTSSTVSARSPGFIVEFTVVRIESTSSVSATTSSDPSGSGVSVGPMNEPPIHGETMTCLPDFARANTAASTRPGPPRGRVST
ncbi:unannotated protein [freshwater metagenome]|uniref:Unannotated protein n=1 Tax=freshwater metagenome TaxID=449393 RepID=A0A6J7UU25_9ZZZZ